MMPMEERLRQEIAGWLEFYRELGIEEFYRRPMVQGSGIRGQGAGIADCRLKIDDSAARGRAGQSSIVNLQPSIPDLRPTTPGPRPPTPRALSLFEAPAPGRRERETPESLEEIRADLGDCQRCKLAPGRQHIVFGQGNPHAELVFVGEGPGADEDAQGLPFVGRAGQLLNKMLQLVGIKRDDVYICNVVKCRPPGNRTPERDEVEACSPFLYRQIEAIHPRLVCCLGAPAVRTVLGLKEGILKLRGRFYDFAGAKALATVHPAYILRNPREEKILREDFEKIRDFLRHRPNA